MVGLIPKTYILHVLKNGCENLLSDNPDFRELCSKEGIELVQTKDSNNLKSIIRQYRPDILLIEDTVFEENLSNPEISYRSKSCQPFKLVIAREGTSKEKVFEYFKQGADEVVIRDISSQEAFLKIFSILRRKSVLEQNQLTGLPSINRTYTILEHCRKNLSDWHAIHVDILHFQSYSHMYGVSSADSAIRETARILTESLKDINNQNAFLGHLGRDNFLVLCDSGNLENILNLAKQNFKTILNNIYKQEDFDSGYIICSAPKKVRRKEGLLDLNIGVCSSIDRNFLSGTDIIEQAVKNKNKNESKNKKVLILEDDFDFASLLEETLSREGSEAKISQGFKSLLSEIEEYQPRTVIIEVARLGHQNFLELSHSLKALKDKLSLKIVIATNIPGYKNFLDAVADVYIPKPYDLETLLKEVRRLRFSNA